MGRSTTTEYYRERSRRWREANRDRYRELARQSYHRNKAKPAALRRERLAMLRAHKEQKGCIDCGATTGRLEFDHRPGESKSFDVSQGTSYSLDVLWAEVEKCDVRCRSCHNKRHGPERRGIPKRRLAAAGRKN